MNEAKYTDLKRLSNKTKKLYYKI